MKTAFFSFLLLFILNFQLFAQAIPLRVLPKNELLRGNTHAITPNGKILIVQTSVTDVMEWNKTILVNDSTCTPLEKLKITKRKNAKGQFNGSVGDFYFTPDMNFVYYKLYWGDKRESLVIKYDLKNDIEQEIQNQNEYPLPYQNPKKPIFFRDKEGKRVLKRTFNKDGQEVKPEVVIDYPLPEGATTGIQVEQILAKGKLLLLGIGGGCCEYNIAKKSRSFTPIQYYFSRLVKGKWTKPLPIKEIVWKIMCVVYQSLLMPI